MVPGLAYGNCANRNDKFVDLINEIMTNEVPTIDQYTPFPFPHQQLYSQISSPYLSRGSKPLSIICQPISDPQEKIKKEEKPRQKKYINICIYI